MENFQIEKVFSAWSEFTRTGHINISVVRPEIADSWKRCREAGILSSADAPKPQVRLVGAALEEERAANFEFIEAARPFMKFLENTIRDSGFILVLSNASGVILETFGRRVVLDELAQQNNYMPGCSRSEFEYGTNSISLALATGRPIQVTGPEHYNVRAHEWTCASAPVLNDRKKILGTITLSGRSTNAHPHTLGLVISAAEAVQNRLQEREQKVETGKINILLSSILSSISEALLVVDEVGDVVQITDCAAKILSVEAGRCVGRNIANLFSLNPDILSVIRDRTGETIELAINQAGERTYCLAKAYRMKPGGVGAIVTLTERKEFYGKVGEISGFKATYRFDHLVGKSPALLRQIELAKMAARQDCRVLIFGETGTGKELFAQAIHNHSGRHKGPFIAINCAAIPRDLLESELMGYKGGAFTGASKNGQIGKIELADGGTLFLDEISQMPLDLQAKLLRVLQDGVISRLGDARPVKVDVRVIAATNEDLFEKGRTGAFRQDLYFRLSVVEVMLPSLADRIDDIPLLSEFILARLSAKMGSTRIGISSEAMDMLISYQWPGNIRQLENILEMASIMCEGGVIEPHHLAARLRREDSDGRLHSDSSTPRPQQLSLREAEIQLLKTTIRELNGNIASVSTRLGMSRSTIYRRMKEYGISRFMQVN